MGVGALILSVFKDLPEKRILNHTNHKNHFKHRKGEKRDERRRTLWTAIWLRKAGMSLYFPNIDSMIGKEDNFVFEDGTPAWIRFL